MITDGDSDVGHGSVGTVKGEATYINNEIAFLRKQNEDLQGKLEEALSRNKSLEKLIGSLHSTIRSLEARIKSTDVGSSPKQSNCLTTAMQKQAPCATSAVKLGNKQQSSAPPKHQQLPPQVPRGKEPREAQTIKYTLNPKSTIPLRRTFL